VHSTRTEPKTSLRPTTIPLRDRVTITTGPRWQDLPPGTRVRPKSGRKRGTVVAIVEPGKLVAVRWDGSTRYSEVWATDCLVTVAPLPETLFSGIASSAFPHLLLDARRRLADLQCERAHGHAVWSDDELGAATRCTLAGRLDHLEASIALEHRLIERLSAEITRAVEAGR
jgi:hypothetical protein